jgi:hypothetical protein
MLVTNELMLLRKIVSLEMDSLFLETVLTSLEQYSMKKQLTEYDAPNRCMQVNSKLPRLCIHHPTQIYMST